MGLNIKNPEAYQLAKELSRLTGESMTATITAALRERLARIRTTRQQLIDDKAAAIMQVVRDSGPSHGMTSKDIDTLLYDEQGLPK